MQVSIVRRVRRPGISARHLRAVVLHALRRERAPARTEVCVVLVNDATIRRLNRRYRRTDRVTDVLAFPIGIAEGRGRLLGDVVISVDRARAHARALGHALRSEMALLAVHGVLHLLDYDDHTRPAAQAMARRQRELLAACGVEIHG